MTCPHCSSDRLDPGSTGLDLCHDCGGLSREGKPLERRTPFATFDEPVVREVETFTATGVVVAAAYVGDEARVLFSFTVDGNALPPITLALEQASDIPKLVADALASLAVAGN